MATHTDVDLDTSSHTQKPTATTNRLTWRGDEFCNFSDWTIVVQQEEPQQAEVPVHMSTFHVHKFILSHGERASGYFLIQFRLSSSTVGTKLGISPLKLPALCVPCVPAFLDFVYEGTLQLSATTALPLMELARRLDVPALSIAVTAWVASALESPCMECPAEFLADAVALRLEKIETDARSVVIKHFGELPLDSFCRLPVDVMADCVQQNDLGVADEDTVFDIVAHYVSNAQQLELCAGATGPRLLWSHVRFAFLSYAKQKETLAQTSIPHDLFFEDAVACLGKHRSGQEAFEVVRTHASEGCARRLVGRTTSGEVG